MSYFLWNFAVKLFSEKFARLVTYLTPGRTPLKTSAATSQFSKEDTICIDTIRTLAADVVFKSNSGHPGAPMGMAAVAHVLFTRYEPTVAGLSTFYVIIRIFTIGL
jgi:hypothetical protein